MAAAMEENRRLLTKLDSEIGDGDHGTNMHRGFQAALERLDGADPASPADVLKAVSMALISKVGGAAAQAAEEGSESTIPLTARRGRASYLGPRAAGHEDPGARSTYLLLDAAARALEESS